MYDINCDGKFNEFDFFVVVFVLVDFEKICCLCGSKNWCKKGVLCMFDGKSGMEIWFFMFFE